MIWVQLLEGSTNQINKVKSKPHRCANSRQSKNIYCSSSGYHEENIPKLHWIIEHCFVKESVSVKQCKYFKKASKDFFKKPISLQNKFALKGWIFILFYQFLSFS